MLEFGRMQLQVEDFLDINKVIYLKSFGYLYPVSVREESVLRSANAMEEMSRSSGCGSKMARDVIQGIAASQIQKGKGAMATFVVWRMDAGVSVAEEVDSRRKEIATARADVDPKDEAVGDTDDVGLRK